MKGRWESNINVWFPLMYSQKWKCYFQNRIILFCLHVPTLIYRWEIYMFPGSVCLFCCRKICGPMLGIHNSLTDTWMWKLGLRQHNSQKRNCAASPNFQIYTSVSDLYIPTIDLHILLQKICGPILGIYISLTDTWMWKLGLMPRNSQKKNT